MTRTQKILFGKEFVQKRTLSAFPNSPLLNKTHELGFYNAGSLQAFGASEQEEFLIVQEARELLSSNRSYTIAWSRPRVMLLAIGNHFQRRGYGVDFSRSLASFIDYGGYREMSGEQRIVSFQMLNEFINQDTYLVYDEFLEEFWDELYDKAVQFTFNEYSNSNALLKAFFSSNIFTFRPSLPRVATRELGALTKDETSKIISMGLLNESIPNTNFRERLKSTLAVIRGEQSVGVPVLQILNTFSRAFAKTISGITPTTSLNILSVQEQFNEALKQGSFYLTNKRSKSSSDMLFTSDVQPYAEYLYENAEKFTPAEMFFACISWLEHKLVARTGSRSDVLEIFNKVLEDYKDDPDNVLSFFRMIGEAGANYDRELPTITHWKKAFTEGYLDAIMGAEITLSLIAGGDKPASRLERQLIYRKTLKGS